MRRSYLLSLLLAFLLGQAASAAEGNDVRLVPTGTLQLSATSVDLIGEQAASSIDDVLPSDVPIEWQVYVPQDYRPELPTGVLVFVSSINWGGIPDHLRQVMDSRNLIWVSANGDGDGAPLQRRMFKAILAPRVVDRDYAIDMARIYVAGYSGGSEVATMIEVAKPELFMGGIYIGGAELWEMESSKIGLISSNHHVFITGSDGRAARNVKRVFKAYKDAGIENTLLLTVPNMRRKLPDERRFMQAIEYLDSRGEQ